MKNTLLKTARNSEIEDRVRSDQLSLRLGCDAVGKTVLRDRYMAYPLSISPIFRLDECHARRAYLYRMNTSPGLLAGDHLSTTLCLEDGSALYLADQAATKIHAMPEKASNDHRQAQVNYMVEVGEQATLEFLPEPLILFADAELKQTTEIVLAPTAGLSWGEVILPGRLARGEFYQFREYWSTFSIKTPTGKLLLVDTTRLLGKANRFVTLPDQAIQNQCVQNQCVQSDLFASAPVMGLLVLCLPTDCCRRENLEKLSQQIDALCSDSLSLASSILPGGRGVFVRAVANSAQTMQRSFKSALDYVRALRNQAPLPYSV